MKLTVLLCCLAAVLYTVSAFPAETTEAPTPPPLNNNKGFRSISDALDSALDWGGYDSPRQSKVRGAIHAAYHEIQYRLTDNQREHERAKDQWGVVSGGRRDNLDRYDREHYGTRNQNRDED
ncbi:uncharacterized protein LOC124356246 [Homalodisca vitripennis]|uniref:uncharacterized protein LOC124356246 n=1 Tax=Homalodisca vitripennis TaxID=197043 RepID=UPI001EEAEAEA|nr:uncharacterized protein LOC124356246 [Homalodisca vitripennis]